MRMTVLGSGGFRRTPRPGCDCDVCQEARASNTRRLGPAMFLHDRNVLFDTPEEVAEEIESAGIGRIDHLFYTHWHPDHTMGARILEVMNTAWAGNMEWRIVPRHATDVHMPGIVYDEVMERLGPLFGFWERMGIARLHRMAAPVEIDGLVVDAIVLKSHHRTTTHSTIYVMTLAGKKIAYGPCDIAPFPDDDRLRGCDLMILQAGWTGERMAERARRGPHYEISLDEILYAARKYRPRKIVLTHIGDELELLADDLKALEGAHGDLNLRFATDGLTLDI